MDLSAATAFIMSFIPKVKEKFEDKPAETKKEATPAPTTSYGPMALVGIFVYIVIMFLQSCAGARLSWCYNKSIGTNTFLAVLYAILCFFFPGFYMILYTFFLAPICGGDAPKENLVESIATNINRAVNNNLVPSSNMRGGARKH